MSSRPFAEATQAEIDSEVARLLREAEERAIGLLRAHQAELRSVVDLLLERETVDGDAVYRALGMEPPEHRQEPAVLAPPQPVPAASHAASPAAGAKGVAPASQQGPTPPDGATGR
jgi:cell division protease FtsH